MNNVLNLDAYDALVIDCWDTLLHRDVVDPADRFHKPGRGCDRFARERRESDERLKAFGRTGSGEITLSSIMDMSGEYAREARGSFLSPSNAQLIETFHKAGKQVLVVSDTYMTGRELELMLGRFKWLPVHTSADHGKTKAEGLIGDVLADLEIDPKRAIVLGDNPNADGRGAQMCGAPYAPYAGYTARIKERLASTNKLAKIHLGRPLRADHKRQLIEKNFPNPYFELGYSLLGPIVGGTLYRIMPGGMEDLTTFVSRDTWLLHELYTGQKQYLCINREIVIRATVRDAHELREAQGAFAQTPGAWEHVARSTNVSSLPEELKRLRAHLATLKPINYVVDLGCRGITFDLLRDRLGVQTQPELLVALPDSRYTAIAKFAPYTAEYVILDRISILETLMKQPVGPLVGYEEDGSPVFKAREPGPQCAIVDEIQAGARAFVADAGPCYQDIEAHLLQLLLGSEPCLVAIENELGPIGLGGTLRVDRDRR